MEISELVVTVNNAFPFLGTPISRRWVHYQIMESMQRGNGLFGVHINGIKDKDRLTKVLGPNPFEYLGLRSNADGTSLQLFEWNNSTWQLYPDLDGYALKTQLPSEQCGQFYQLTKWFPVYDWIADHGYNNFSAWVERHS